MVRFRPALRTAGHALLALLAAAPGTALAHPGEHHGGLLDALMHLLGEPDHLAMLLGALVAGLLLARRSAAARARRQAGRHRAD